MDEDVGITIDEPLNSLGEYEDSRTIYQTKDLNQAAFVWCHKGVTLLRLDGSSKPGSSLYFVLELCMPEEKVGKLIIDYANQRTRVEPMQMVANQNKLRDLLKDALQKKLRKKGEKNETY